MIMDGYDDQMMFGDLGGRKASWHFCLTGEEKPWKNLTQETCPDRGSNPGPLRERRAFCHLIHSGGHDDDEDDDDDDDDDDDTRHSSKSQSGTLHC